MTLIVRPNSAIARKVRDDRNRNRQAITSDRRERPKEDEERQHRQETAEIDVVHHEVDRGVDVDRLAVDVLDVHAARFHDLFVDDVDLVMRPSITSSTLAPTWRWALKAMAGSPMLAHQRRRLLVVERDIGDIADMNRHAVADGDDRLLDRPRAIRNATPCARHTAVSLRRNHRRRYRGFRTAARSASWSIVMPADARGRDRT